jgi:lipid A 3-O-deacylase
MFDRRNERSGAASVALFVGCACQISVMRGRLVLFVWLSTFVCVADLAASGPVHCADMSLALPPLIDEFREPGNQFEARFGAFAAGVGSAEQDTFDLNASLLTPRLNPGLQGYAAYLLPRLQFGGALNLAGRTSFAHADIALTLPIVKKLFFEPFLGGAIHNGSLTPTPTLSGLGCPVLIHAGFTFGIAVTEHWTALATFEHLSNGKGLGVDCGTNQALGTNQGLNNYGLSVGYAF